MNIYEKSVEQVIKAFNTDLIKGLSFSEAKEYLKKYGPNIIPIKRPLTYLEIFLSQFKNPLIYILIAAAAIIFFFDNKEDAFFISFILLLNALVGTYQEGRSGNILNKLQKIMHTHSVVIRDGKRHIIESSDLVPGDLILVVEGDQVPADARIIEVSNLEVDESSLSGESIPIIKITKKLSGKQPFFEQRNMIFSGTYVTRGSAKAIVSSTGIFTTIGFIKKEIEGIDTKIPLISSIEKIAFIALWAVIFICVALFFLGILTGKDVKSMLTMLAALFICVVPEGLPVIVTLILAMGVARLAKKNVLVKRLAAVEGLGQADVIAIDKTGTLTKNEVIVEKIITNSGIEIASDLSDKKIAFIAALISGAQIDKETTTEVSIKGDPTEVSLTKFGLLFGFDKFDLEKQLSLFKEISFSVKRKLKAIFVKVKQANCFLDYNKVYLFVLGAPEALDELVGSSNDFINIFLKDGYRVLSLAEKSFTQDEWLAYEKEYLQDPELEKFYDRGLSELKFTASYGMQDEIRPDVFKTIQYVKNNDIHVVMITGDHLETAKAIAQKSGILSEYELSVTGKDLEINDIEKISVFARVSPQEKLTIIKKFQKNGHIVAMTGDGVNDVPSLVAADLGIAMGQIGTEVAKEASDIIIMDDSFGSIVEAIEEGRHIFNILKKVLLYFFATNSAEILIILFALAIKFPLPLLAIQILWLNLITDGVLNLALSMEPKNELKEESFSKVETILINKNLFFRVLYMSVPMALGSLYLFNFYLSHGIMKARTVTFFTMAFFQMFNVWNCRSERDSVFFSGLFSNVYLLGSSILIFGLQLSMVYFKPMQLFFKTIKLNLQDWLLILLISSMIIVLEELRKLYLRVTRR